MDTDATFDNIYAEADAAGHGAAAAVDVQELVIRDMFTGKTYHEPEGICGFAEIRFRGNTAWGRWAKKFVGAKKAYTGGLYIWVSDFGQSYDRKRAYAIAFARTLAAHGIDAYATARLD